MTSQNYIVTAEAVFVANATLHWRYLKFFGEFRYRGADLACAQVCYLKSSLRMMHVSIETKQRFLCCLYQSVARIFKTKTELKPDK